jgi:hypothetical protein
MTVKELIEELNKMPQDATVEVLYSQSQCEVCAGLTSESCSLEGQIEIGIDSVNKQSEDWVTLE